MPGAAEFQAPSSSALRSPRASVPRFERGPDVGQSSALSVVTSQPMTVECMSVGDAIETAGAGYCIVTTSMPMASQPHLGPMPTSGPVAGLQNSGGVVYWMPVVTVPYASSMGQVNLGWAPSQDPYGKDLPLSDMNTLRYFFNLGVEYFRISAAMQQQHQHAQQPQTSYLTASPVPQLIPGGGHPSYMTLDQGYPGAMPTAAPPAQGHLSQGQVVYVMNPPAYGPAPPCTTYQPTYMASAARAMGLPCPPVAVQ